MPAMADAVAMPFSVTMTGTPPVTSQLCRIAVRRLEDDESLPLCAVRVSEAFLRDDEPPAGHRPPPAHDLPVA